MYIADVGILEMAGTQNGPWRNAGVHLTGQDITVYIESVCCLFSRQLRSLVMEGTFIPFSKALLWASWYLHVEPIGWNILCCLGCTKHGRKREDTTQMEGANYQLFIIFFCSAFCGCAQNKKKSQKRKRGWQLRPKQRSMHNTKADELHELAAQWLNLQIP